MAHAQHSGRRDARVTACVRYGFCTSVCPTYEILRNENDGPRGRIALIKEMYASDRSPKKSTVSPGPMSFLLLMHQHVRCGSELSSDHRRRTGSHRENLLATNQTAPPALDRLDVLTRPWLGRLLIEVGKRVPRPVAAALPGRLRRFVSLARETIIAKGPVAPAGEKRAAVTRGTIVPVEGCIQQVIAPRINDAAARFLERLGFSVRRTRTQCCGALALHMRRPDKAKQTAAKLAQEVEGHLSDDLQGIVITASGCGAVAKEYDKLFTGTAFEALARRVFAKGARYVRDCNHHRNLASRARCGL